jgi:hypothetical protein
MMSGLKASSQIALSDISHRNDSPRAEAKNTSRLAIFSKREGPIKDAINTPAVAKKG